jgi:hypothetical protein
MSSFVAHQNETSASPDSREPTVLWKPWATGWLGVLALAFMNGGLHRAYEPALGVLRAEQLSNVVLLAAVVPWAMLVDRRHPTSTTPDALVVGALWGAMTVTFEFVGGHYINGDDWTTLIQAYDLSAGHLWPMTVAVVAVSPLLARWRRLRRR